VKATKMEFWNIVRLKNLSLDGYFEFLGPATSTTIFSNGTTCNVT